MKGQSTFEYILVILVTCLVVCNGIIFLKKSLVPPVTRELQNIAHKENYLTIDECVSAVTKQEEPSWTSLKKSLK